MISYFNKYKLHHDGEQEKPIGMPNFCREIDLPTETKLLSRIVKLSSKNVSNDKDGLLWLERDVLLLDIKNPVKFLRLKSL